MRRAGRRQGSNYLEENEELNTEFTEELSEEYEDLDLDTEDSGEVLDSEEERSASGSIWKKIGKVAIVILALIALFFISMKVTEIFLDKNQEVENYDNGAPAYSETEQTEETETEPVAGEDPLAEEDPLQDGPTYSEDSPGTPSKKPSGSTSTNDKPKNEEPSKPSESDEPSAPSENNGSSTPSESDEPSTPSENNGSSEPSESDEPAAPSTTPSTEPSPSTPSTPSKPPVVINPGNPAA